MNLIQQRMSLFSKVAFPLVQCTEALVRREDLVKWSHSPDGELRPDTTRDVPEPLSAAVWEMIHSLVP